MEPKFILSKKILKEQVRALQDIGLKVSYSYKTNREVGGVLQDLEKSGEIKDVDFSIHAREEIEDISDKNKIWFFTQAESEEELREILVKGVRKFVIDNEVDLGRLLKVIKETKIKITLSLRMKFQEHRIGSGKYFVYGMSPKTVNKLISELRKNPFVEKLGVHIHRKSQNVSEWEIKQEVIDYFNEESLEAIDFFNFGGGLPSKYRSYNLKVLDYIFLKLKEAKGFLAEKGIISYIEPGRFLAAPCIKLETEIIQIQGGNIIINTTIYNCSLDTILTGTKMLVEGELSESREFEEEKREKGENYLIKGNSPTRDDIFRYKVKLNSRDISVGKKIVFLNAGAYNYTTDFFGFKKLDTHVVEDFD